MARMTGVVRFWNDTKGYGFITPDNGEQDCFVHRTAIVGATRTTSLAEGDRAQFDVVQGHKGIQAQGVVRL